MKTFLKEATILSVFDFQNNEKKLLGLMLYGVVIKDETSRFEPNFRVAYSHDFDHRFSSALIA